MGTEHQPEDAIDKVLAALRDSPPPEGMNARIAARLEQTPARPSSHWRALLTGQSLAAAWFRGAATGAAFALLAVAAILALRHTPAPPRQARESQTHAPTITPVSASAPRNTTPYPCAHPSAFRVATSVAPHNTETPWTEDIAENTAPSRPAPVMPLTAQERQLVHLVRAAEPAQLAAISHVSQAKQQDAAELARFFAPPPPSPTSEASAPAKPEPDTQATPESAPEAAPEEDQPSSEAGSGITSPANE